MNHRLHFYYLFIWLLIISCGSLQAQQSTAIVTGSVRASDTELPLSEVNIFLPNTHYGTITNEQGRFTLRLQPSDYQIIFSFIGYELVRRNISVDAGDSLVLDISLNPAPVGGGAVIVEDEVQTPYLNTQYRVNTESVENIPMVGEPDIFSTLKTLPGVIQTNDRTNNLYIRGGSGDQNAIYLDGVQIYNPYHLFGLFGGINLLAIESVALYPADFPVKFSGKLSGIIDIQSKSTESNETSINLGLVASSIALTRDFGETSILAAYRRTYLDALSGAFGFDIPYRFSDANFKIRHHIANGVSVNAWAYFSRDYFTTEEISLDNFFDQNINTGNKWGNSAFAFQIVNETEENTSRLSISSSENILSMSERRAYNVDNTISNVELRGDVIENRWFGTFHMGFYLRKFLLNYDWDGDFTLERIFYREIPLEFNYHLENYMYGIYLQEDVALSESFLFSIGIAWDEWNIYNKFSPRLNMKYRFPNDSVIKLTGGIYYQAYSRGAETIEGSVMGPTFRNSTPSRANSYSLGYERKLNEFFTTNIEIYHRQFEDIVEIQTSNRFPEFHFGEGTTTGLDFYLKKGLGKFTYQLTGSLLSNRVSFRSESYKPYYDTPYSLNIVSSYNLGRGFSLSAQGWYQSGTPYTPVLQKFLAFRNPLQVEDQNAMEIQFIEGDIHSARLSDYFRFDASIQKMGSWGAVDYTIYMQVINLFNTGNILRYQWYEYYYNRAQNDSEQGGTVESLPIIPSLGLKLNF